MHNEVMTILYCNLSENRELWNDEFFTNIDVLARWRLQHRSIPWNTWSHIFVDLIIPAWSQSLINSRISDNDQSYGTWKRKWHQQYQEHWETQQQRWKRWNILPGSHILGKPGISQNPCRIPRLKTKNKSLTDIIEFWEKLIITIRWCW